jgi:large subunit ribosomal protein L9
MQIYLIKDLPGKGKAGEIISVNDGYGRNFIIKNGIGRSADGAILAQVKAKQQSDAFHKAREVAEIKKVCGELEKTVVRLAVKVGAGGKMYGAVTGHEISGALLKLGFKIDKKNLVHGTVKELGTYIIKVKFNYGLMSNFTLEVINGNTNAG